MSVKAVKLGNGAGSFVDAIFPGTSQKVAFTGTSAQSAALGASTSVVEVISTQNCHIKTGEDPTATADGTSMYLPANVMRRIAIVGGHKIAAIQDSSGGNLFITEAASV